MADLGEREPLADRARGARRGGPAMSVDQKAVYVELASMGVDPGIADLMARRQPVKPAVTRQLRAEQARDDLQARNDAADRDMKRAGGPAAAGERDLKPQTVAEVQRQADAAVRQTARVLAGTPAAAAPDAPLPQPRQAYVRPVILVEGVDRGGNEDLGGDVVVRAIPYVGKAGFRKIDDAVSFVNTPAATGPGTSPNAVQMVGGPVGDTPAAKSSAVRRVDNSEVRIADLAHIAAIATGVMSPPVGLGMIALSHVAVRAAQRSAASLEL